MSVLGKIVNGYATKKEVEEIINHGGSQTGGRENTGGGTTNDHKLAVQFTFFSDDSKTHTGLDDITANDFLFKLATTSTSETIATGTIRSRGRKSHSSNEPSMLEYIPGQSGSGDFDLICKNQHSLYDKFDFEIRSLTRIEKINYDSQANSEEPELTRMYFYNISDQEMSSAVGIIELAKLSLNIIFFK